MSTRNIVKNIRSAEVIQGKPKLPTSDQLGAGEIAVNYAKGYETLSFKNNSNEIVSLSVKTVDDITVNGSSVVSNKTANITMKGSTTPVADTYSRTTFPSPFESKAEHISADDKVDAALKKVETNISKLASDVITNENTNSDAISKLANSAGTIDGSNNIKYIKATNAHYISNATSVHDATVKLDTNVYSIDTKVNTLKGDVTTIKGSISSLGTDVTNIRSDVSSLDSFCYSNINILIQEIGDLQSQINRLRATVEFVDLGLPSGTLWAKCNIGAPTETDYGDYFMWGSTTPDNNHTCNWANTPFNNGSSVYNETYFTDDVKNTLCPSGVLAKNFDAVYKATNGIGRMPKSSEFEELIDNTTKEWTTINGVKGYKFTSKKDESKYIFIPAAGSRIDSSLSHIGSSGGVWSSSLSLDHDLAYSLDFSQGAFDINNHNRYYGWPVRAVRNLPL